MSLRDDDVKVARKKGAVAAVGGAVALGVMAASPVLGILALAPVAYLGWDWFKFRAKRGMRF